MAASNQVVGLNGFEVWAFGVELDDGVRMQLALDDWQKLNLDVGRKILVRLRGRDDMWLFVTNVTELPPIVWVMMARRIGAAG